MTKLGERLIRAAKEARAMIPEIIGTSPYDNPNPWRPEEIQELINMYERGKSFGQIGIKLKRTRSSVASKVMRLAGKGVLKRSKPTHPNDIKR